MRTSRYWSWASGVQRRERRRAASASSSRADVARRAGRRAARREQPLQRGGAERQRGSWPKPGSRAPVEVAAEELARHRPLRDRRAREVRDRAARAAAGASVDAGCARPEAAHLGLAEQVVAGEHLVGALAGQHDLDAGVAHQLRQQEQRRRRGAQDRPLGVARSRPGRRARCRARDDHDLVVLAARARSTIRRWNAVSSYSASSKRSEKVVNRSPLARRPSAATSELSRPPDR